MWRWWVVTFIHNCVWIFWFVTRNAKILKNSKNEFQWTTKHDFWQDFFLHMRPASQARHLKPIENNVFVKWLKKSPFPYSVFLQILKTLKFLYNLVFYQVHIMNIYFHRRGHVFIVIFFEINCMILCIPFDSFKTNM
jgi:hypothetical protein